MICSGFSRFKYEEGKSYTYQFETDVNTQVVGSSDEQNKIKVKGQAVISAESPCSFVLSVSQISIVDSNEQVIS